jgi:hypothetical protein
MTEQRRRKIRPAGWCQGLDRMAKPDHGWKKDGRRKEGREYPRMTEQDHG